MKTAPLQLLDYWADFIQVEANPDFDAEKKVDLPHASLEVLHSVQPLPTKDDPDEAGTAWNTRLEIIQTIPDGKNLPYTFTLRMQGIVAAHPAYKGDELERVVSANAPAMLFGAAREVIRAATGRGPYAPILIPSTNFLKDPVPKKVTKKTAKKVAKKTAKKVATKKK